MANVGVVESIGIYAVLGKVRMYISAITSAWAIHTCQDFHKRASCILGRRGLNSGLYFFQTENFVFQIGAIILTVGSMRDNRAFPI